MRDLAANEQVPVPVAVAWDADDDDHCNHSTSPLYDDEDFWDPDEDYCIHCECCCTCLSCEYGHIDAPPSFGGSRG